MKLLGRNLLTPLKGLDPDTDRWLKGWTSELVQATWKSLSDVKKQYPTVVSQENGVLYFWVAAQRKKIKVIFSFSQGIAIIDGLNNVY